MRSNAKSQRLLVTVATLATITMISATASAKSSKHTSQAGPVASAESTANALGSAPDADHSPAASQREGAPGPAWRTVGGTVKQIKGNTYTVEDYEGNQIQLSITQGTKQLRGHKKVGDPVRAEITRGGFANSIQ